MTSKTIVVWIFVYLQ